MKDLYTIIIEAYPQLEDNVFADGTIILQDDSDGKGVYIKEWNTELEIPNGLTIGKLNGK